MGHFSFISKLCIPLSLSLNLKKDKSQEKTFIFVDCPIIICFDTLKVYITVVKEFIYFYVATWSMLFFAVLLRICCCHISFSASIRLMLSCLELSYQFLKNITRETGVADYYNIILLRQKTYRSILFCCLGGRSLAAW